MHAVMLSATLQSAEICCVIFINSPIYSMHVMYACSWSCMAPPVQPDLPLSPLPACMQTNVHTIMGDAAQDP